MINPFSLLVDRAVSVKTKANRREKRLSKALDAVLHPLSGAFAGHKGDFSSDAFVFDSKGTDDFSIRVQIEDLRKIRKEADLKSKHPALVLTVCGEDWVVLPLSVFREMSDG